MKCRDFLGLLDNWKYTVCVVDENYNIVAEGTPWNVLSHETSEKEVLQFGFYNNKLCVKIAMKM